VYYIGLYIHHSCNYKDKLSPVNCGTFTILHVDNYERRYVARSLHKSESVITPDIQQDKKQTYIWFYLYNMIPAGEEMDLTVAISVVCH